MNADEARIARLLRLADPGPEIPAGGEARIRAAVLPLWRREVRRRSVRRLATIGALAAAATAVIFFVSGVLRNYPTAAPPIPVARVELVRGPVEENLRQRVVMAGSLLHTSPQGRAALRLAQGASLRLDHDTTVRLVSAHTIDLKRGAVYVDSSLLRDAPIEIRTPLARIVDIGTRFEVRTGDGLLVRVRDGSVDISTRKQQVRVNAGFESRVRSDGSQEVSAFVPDGDPWTAAIAPPFAIEGRSVAALLQWCSRETGLTLRYSSRDAEHTARTTLLHGTVNGLQPLEMAEVVLPTAGLEAVHKGGDLVIRMRRNPLEKSGNE
jgi:FecR protein